MVNLGGFSGVSVGMSDVNDKIQNIFLSLGLQYGSGHRVAPTFSTKPPRQEWQAVLFETESGLAIYHLITKEKSITTVRPFMDGIGGNHYVIVVSLADHDCLFIRNFQKGSKVKYHTFPLRKDSEYNRATTIFRKHRITADILTAHAGLANIVRDMTSSNAFFTNRGLFSTYYLEKRMFKEITRKKRNLDREANPVLDVLRSVDGKERIPLLLKSLGYDMKKSNNGYSLSIDGKGASSIIVTDHRELDVKHGDVIPSMQAVAELRNHEWVMLTNGRIWRMYSSKVSSASTNYFEVDLEQADDVKDARIRYFVAIFGAKSLHTKNNVSQLDVIHEGSVAYASELEANMRNEIFDGDMFTMLVRGVLDHDKDKEYSRSELDSAKRMAIRILYRLLFILYAESRYLLPVDHSEYKKISMLSMRDGLESFQKDEESHSCWNNLKVLFSGINSGNSELNLPQYSGKLFEKGDIDDLAIRNRFLVPVIHSMTEKNGEGVDYQSLGVRHLGSIYEGLLEYDVVQAKEEIVLVDGEIINAEFATDLSKKPDSYISKNDIYLSSGGMARKGTGSYFTPEPIVKNLVKKGLEPILRERTVKFAKGMQKFRRGDAGAKDHCNDLLLDLQVLDPAMGSGHFLVTVADEITRWIMQIINEHPDAPIVQIIEKQRKQVIETQEREGIKLNTDLLTANSILKRIVMKNCIYGVDINELSVELAKLSLWLDSFTIGMPLTMLRHHIRWGNALIGIHDKSGTRRNGSLDDFMGETMASGGKILGDISKTPDIISDDIKHGEDRMEQFMEKTRDLREKMNGRCVHIMLQNEPRKDEIHRTATKHSVFHWEIEFPDAFTDQRPGFDLIVGNPPWEAVKPNDDEFFSIYDPHFRAHSSKQDKKRIKEKLLQKADVKAAFDDYTAHIEEQSRFFKESGQYAMRGKGDTDMWKLFLERMMGLVTEGGMLAVVVPSGILTNEGAKDLRKAMLKMRIVSIYGFENRRKIFPEVDSRYKFILLTASNTTPQSDFEAAFYLHDVASLHGKTEKDKFLSMPIDLIRLTSPDMFAISEVRSRKDVEILNQVYSKHACVKDGLDNGKYTIGFVRELDRTNDSRLFRRDGKGWPLIEGKNFHQFVPDYSKSEFTILPEEGLNKTKTRKNYKNKNNEIHESFRLSFRDVARSTDIRTMISCILPPRRFFSNKSPLVIIQHHNNPILNNIYNKKILYLAAIFNSMVFDYLIRLKTNTTLNFFIVEGIALPKNTESKLAQKIIKLSSMLTIQNQDFSNMAKNLQLNVKKLTIQQRIKITAELDALVAHHYRLNRNHYEHILSTFKPKKQNSEFNDFTEWNDGAIHALNYEVKDQALKSYDNTIFS